MSCYNTIPRNLRLRLQESLIDTISNALLEEFHILRTFDDVVDDIYDTFIKNRGRMYGLIYTGWKLNIETSECVKCKETENEDLYSIFVYWETNWNSNANATTDIRGIDINLNDHIVKINANVVKGFNIKTIKSIFHHEFIHVKHMYKFKNKNIILNNKNMADNIDNIFNISDELLDKVKDILYLMSPTEIQARINQQYRLICDLTNEEINEIIKNNDIIGSLIQYFKNINLYDKYLLDFNILLKNDIVSNNYEYVLLLNIIGYYGHMQKLLKNDIKESSIRKMLQNNKYTSLDKQNADKVKYDINKFISNYLLKLQKAINYALKENKFDEYYRESLFSNI